MEKVSKFYVWFYALGGRGMVKNVNRMVRTLNEPEFLVSSLKNRAAEIKNLYNYKFKQNEN
jgi:hypothetical protein